MSGSTWVDLAVLLVALLAASSGWRQGAVASGLALFGVVIGAMAGILVAPRVLSGVQDDGVRLLSGILVIIALVVIGEVSGMVLGRTARSFMHSPAARAVDSTIGSLFQALAVFVAAWLLAVPLANSSQTELASAVRGSWVLSKINAVAPEQLQALPSKFADLMDTSGLPDVLGPFGRTPITTVDPPDPALQSSRVVTAVQPSVLKVRGVASRCQKALEGTGFVVGPERVMTNAHVVAGTSSVTLETEDGELHADVVLYDPQVDVAVLQVPGLSARALDFASLPAKSGTGAIVLGYPSDGPYTATSARVRETVNLKGPNIYRSQTVQREVYTVRGTIRQGNSGGPLIDEQGDVLGVVFGAAVDNSDTGYVLTAREVSAQLAQAQALNSPADTGACVA